MIEDLIRNASPALPLEIQLAAAAMKEKVAALDAHSLAAIAALTVVFLVLAGPMLENVLRSTLRFLGRLLIFKLPLRILNIVLDKLLDALMVVGIALIAGITWLAGPAEFLHRLFH